MTCKQCGREEWMTLKGRRGTTVNKDGLCPVCVEVNGEAAADREERQEKAAASMMVHISPNNRGNPPGKLADVELHFEEGPLAGLKLCGFAIWERRGGNSRNVTFPARAYSVNGERRSFALLQPLGDPKTSDVLRDAILEAFALYEETRAAAV